MDTIIKSLKGIALVGATLLAPNTFADANYLKEVGLVKPAQAIQAAPAPVQRKTTPAPSRADPSSIPEFDAYNPQEHNYGRQVNTASNRYNLHIEPYSTQITGTRNDTKGRYEILDKGFDFAYIIDREGNTHFAGRVEQEIGDIRRRDSTDQDDGDFQGYRAMVRAIDRARELGIEGIDWGDRVNIGIQNVDGEGENIIFSADLRPDRYHSKLNGYDYDSLEVLDRHLRTNVGFATEGQGIYFIALPEEEEETETPFGRANSLRHEIYNRWYTHLDENCNEAGFTLEEIVRTGDDSYRITYNSKNPLTGEINTSGDNKTKELNGLELGRMLTDVHGEYRVEGEYEDSIDYRIMATYSMMHAPEDTKNLMTEVLMNGLAEELGPANTVFLLGSNAASEVLANQVLAVEEVDGKYDTSSLERARDRIAKEKGFFGKGLQQLSFSITGYTNPAHINYTPQNTVLGNLVGDYKTAAEQLTTENGGLTADNLTRARDVLGMGWQSQAGDLERELNFSFGRGNKK